MGRRIRSKAVNFGLNRDQATYDDKRYVRCWNCGFINHLDRESRASDGSRAGDGITHNTYYDSVWGALGWGTNMWGRGGTDFTITGGCAFCGCLLWDKRR